MRNRFEPWLLVAGGLALAVMVAAAPVGGEDVQNVSVLNFPPLQQVAGEVDIRGPVRLASSFARRKVTVLPTRGMQLRDLTEGGELRTESFSRAVVTLAGVATARVVGRGVVGAILVPDDPEILETWHETGVAQLAIRVEAAVEPTERGLFESAPFEFRPAFPSYRVYFYDTLSASVEVRFHAYLTSA